MVASAALHRCNIFMSAQPTSIFIDGAHGTTGLELQSQLEALPQHFKLITIPDAQRKDPSVRTAILVVMLSRLWH